MKKFNIEETLNNELEEAQESDDERRRSVADSVASSGLVGTELGRAEDVEAYRRTQALSAARTNEQLL